MGQGDEDVAEVLDRLDEYRLDENVRGREVGVATNTVSDAYMRREMLTGA
jgi:hypothetical protein